MAGTAMYASMLPCIKCSTCGQDVELSMMGDHKCESTSDYSGPSPSSVPTSSGCTENFTSRSDHDRTRAPSLLPQIVPPVSQPHMPRKQSPLATPPLQHDEAYELEEPEEPVPSIPDPLPSASNHYWNDGLQESGETEPPRMRPKPPPINSSAANNYRTTSDVAIPPSAVRPSIDSMAFFQGGDGFMPERSASGPPGQPFKPPPNEPEQAQELNIPVVPSMKRTHTSPLLQMESASSNAVDLKTAPTIDPPLHPKTPNTPHSAKEGSGITRSNSFFSSKKKHQPRGASQEKIGLGIFRRKSSKSFSKKDISAPDISTLKPIPTVPNLPSPTSLAKLDRDGRPLPTGPAPPRPARPTSDKELFETLKNAANNAQQPALSSSPSKDPLPEQANSRSEMLLHPSNRISAPLPVAESPPTSPKRSAQNTNGLPGISEDNNSHANQSERVNAAPPAWPAGRLRSLSRSDPSIKPKMEPPPVLPRLATSPERVGSQPSHSPAESLSSSGSRYGFDEKTDSSFSSPPTSNASSFSHWNKSLDSQASLRTPDTDPSQPSSTNSLRATANFSRLRVVESPAPSLGNERPHNFHDWPVPKMPDRAPTPQSTTSSQFPDLGQPSPPGSRQEEKCGQISRNGSTTSFEKSPLPPTPEDEKQMPRTRPSLSRRKTTNASKGDCRGCNQAITGKSVKAADGRLTGRYHKECFVCKTCKEQFVTADFYVLRNEPYCSRHYHTLNNSLCQHCNQGIEGRYLEAWPARKFHQECFTCHDCRKPLSRDYFEVNGVFLCEADAMRLQSRIPTFAPGRPRFPEKRTTKLMMMEAG